MGISKWIGGFLGFMTGGPLGALWGFVMGWLYEKGMEQRSLGDDSAAYSSSRADSGSYRSSYEEAYGSAGVNMGDRNSFLFSILVLASYIIRADGKVMHSEMEHVRSFLRTNFGNDALQQGEEILRRLFDRQKQMESQQRGSYDDIVMQSCRQIATNLSYGQRLQLLAFMAGIVRADGIIDNREVDAMRKVARAMRLNDKEVDSMLNLRDASTSLEAAYKVLEIAPTASDDEVKKAYRRMALKHHPDKVAALGEDVRRAAEKKFQEINAAKDLIYKSRGL